jgi:hypothetical protein
VCRVSVRARVCVARHACASVDLPPGRSTTSERDHPPRRPLPRERVYGEGVRVCPAGEAATVGSAAFCLFDDRHSPAHRGVFGVAMPLDRAKHVEHLRVRGGARAVVDATVACRFAQR